MLYVVNAQRTFVPLGNQPCLIFLFLRRGPKLHATISMSCSYCRYDFRTRLSFDMIPIIAPATIEVTLVV